MHIGVIPDGNRRFMEKNGIANLKESYQMGINKFHDFLDWCIDLGVNEVTIYVLSSENIQNRGKDEVHTLLNLFSNHALSVLNDDRIHKNGVKINICGDLDYLAGVGNPIGQKVVGNLTKLENSTKDYDNLDLNVAIAYGGRQELLHAVGKLIDSGEKPTEENIRKNLWVKGYPDIIIRTSESRLSNFLLWQCAYSEIQFVDKLWQEFQKEDLVQILNDYNSKERRFGK
ncbi:MAG: polyprenyl diphosphate synthase [Candidatus Altiarchaeales archaeon]|nr:di-trans,poly-cis-decaprenylcistransferase [Candidatus Altiarchaeota archaeon]MBU4266705.1 di-trans,poly-cis-decaprenylcistransferase [Candidatus Altiarchaeota archaeon]MBU4342011.1 di-trans,poly-cis-decaprenylcistransferase [Candidatus Altiarchaeota archaeon]MBU4437609.1 di-trans,poly-cis-decaprenylcistransferase [Candidatus Altiarchaeota archaeon]MCG2782140.1 polyprenyl diphosphate synthase [Candidatus Altiarchaeales archaeon]